MGSVLFLIESFWASVWYRTHNVAEELRRQGHEAIVTNQPTPEQIEACDVISSRMWINPMMGAAIEQGKTLGKPFVLDVDDNVWTLHPDNPGFAHYADPKVASEAKKYFKMADRVTSATDYLIEKLSFLNPNMVLLENFLPQQYWPQEAKNLLDGNPIVIGWAGSTSHAPDIRILSGIPEIILNNYDDVMFAFTQSCPLPFELPNPRILTLEPTPMDKYSSLVQQFDIGLAPVIDNEFNKAKSDLKVIEYGICGIPTVASQVTPYIRGIKPGFDGYLCQNGKDWIKNLKRMLNDRDMLVEMGQNARVKAEKRLLHLNIDKWEDALFKWN